MPRRSRDKGNAFERKVVQIILKTVGKQFSGKDCYRTPCSGGHRFAGKSDLKVSKRLMRPLPFCIECKHTKEFQLHKFMFDGLNLHFRMWHKQVLHAAKVDTFGRHPVLIIRGNGGPIYASAPVKVWPKWDARLATEVAGLHYKYKGKDWRLIMFDDFLATLKDKAKAA